ncbi:hypothetical protein [Paenarthrobacter ureafaciens]|uniref:hypothetical protein n=1 Tax=Paenarthrobacter ureafaciens TaxID=37931 RepID=UPI00140E8E6F|nr:hypothetical protein [Paenarthrobacter ureafaciens]MCX8455335.1 hypothetical protein [Paenarthrobacter ureafaciens]MCY0974062.1 hypothetical protein [Paenarthrobacter ureafaciens]
MTIAEQHLYWLLSTHPDLNYVGVVDWRTARLAAMAVDATRAGIQATAESLQAKRFVFIDEETEEILIRSFMRHDGLLKQPKLSISMVNAYGSVASKRIREVVTFELQRLHSEFPEWAAFRQEKVMALIKGKGTDMDGFTQEFSPALTPMVTPAFTLNAGQADPLPTTTATTTATSSNEDKKINPRKRKSSCPETFPITEAMRSWAKDNNITVDLTDQTARFLDHHTAKGSMFTDWTRAWYTWMRNAKDWAKPAPDTGQTVPAAYGWANR